MRITGVVGAPSKALGTGTEENLRLVPVGGLAISTVSSKYSESVRLGRVWSAQTAVTGVAPGTAIGTTAAFTLYNPKNSGVHLAILRTTMGYVSGTLGAGTIFYVANVDSAAAAVTGTAIVPVNRLLGNGASATGKAFTTATLPATPTIVGTLWSLQASLATTAVAPWMAAHDVEGAILISAGCALSLEAVAAAGTTPLVVYGMVWEEVPAE